MVTQSDFQVSFRNVAKSFGSLEVHRDVSFDISKGEVVTILGPSGTGKSVILKLIIGLLTPTSGKIVVFNTLINNLRDHELIDIRSEVGMLFQGAALFDSLTVSENIAYGLRERGINSDEEIAEIVQSKLEIVKLASIAKKTPPELSGGQKKRVALARALATSPKVVLFDEPTTGLDPTSVRMIDELILQLKSEFGITSVVVTHDIESARRVSDRWILINQGRILADGRVDNLLSSSSEVKAFVKGEWNES